MKIKAKSKSSFINLLNQINNSHKQYLSITKELNSLTKDNKSADSDYLEYISQLRQDKNIALIKINFLQQQITNLSKKFPEARIINI